jgi:hypothetical protein
MTSGQTNSIYCPHCGTGNEPNASICDRCGERVYRPNVDQPPPLGLAACGKCDEANEARAFYCVNCGHSMESAVRISPEGATSSSRAAEQPQTSSRITKPDPPAPQRRTPEPRASVVTQKSVRPEQGLPNSTGSAAENGSGVRGAELPESLRGFNWGAFLMGPIWSLFNQVWIGLIGFISVIPQIPIEVKLLITLALALYLGFKGNELAWRSKKWSSVAHFASAQRTWFIVGLAATVVFAILSIIFIQGAPAETIP